MDGSTARAPEKGKPSRKEYINAFATAMARFTAPSAGETVLAEIPALMVEHFEAARSELWLWDDSSGSAYLTYAAGQEAERHHDYATLGEGVIGKLSEGRKPLHNLALAAISSADAKFAERTGLASISAYPIVAKGRLLGILANYCPRPVDEELLNWWDVYAEIAAITVQEVLASQESQKTITQLSLLFEATRLLNSTLDLAELLELILKIARTEVKADRGTVFLVDQKRGELWSIVASGLEREEIRVALGQGVAGRVAQTGETINVEDAYSLEFMDRSFDQKFGYRTKSLLSMPIRHRTGEIVGVIQLLNQTTEGRFTAAHEDFLGKLSGHMAMALENARLHRDALEKQRMEKELALARTIQRSLLPEAPPVVPGYEIAVLNEPCYEVGGDYYDFLHLGPQTLLLVVADVEGKGVSSALVMSNLQATLRALVMHLHSLEVLTLSLNEMIYNDSKSSKYLSIFLGLVDTRRHGLHYINAGHVPPLLIDGASGKARTLDEGGTVIGLFPRAEYHRGMARLKPGDVLVLCTDGIPEAMDEQEEEYGAERLAACVAANRTRTAQGIVDAVLAEVGQFSRAGTHIDDKVLMVVKCAADGAMTSAGSSKPTDSGSAPQG